MRTLRAVQISLGRNLVSPAALILVAVRNVLAQSAREHSMGLYYAVKPSYSTRLSDMQHTVNVA